MIKTKEEFEDEENELQIQKSLEEDMFEHDCHKGPEDACQICDTEETLCGKPHNNGDDRPEACNECMVIKEDI